MALPDVLRYSDHQSYLRDWYAQWNTGGQLTSIAALSRKLGLKSRSHMQHLLRGSQIPLGTALALRISRLIGHSPEERDWFLCLAAYSRPGDDTGRSHALQALRESRAPMRPRTLGGLQLQYFSRWYLPVLRELASMSQGSATPRQLSARLAFPVPEQEIRTALSDLVRLGLLQRISGGRYRQCEPILENDSSAASATVVEYQKEMLELAKSALDTCPVQQRAVLTSTIGIPRSLLPRFQKMAQRFQQAVTREASNSTSPTDSVYQVQLQIFPLTQESRS